MKVICAWCENEGKETLIGEISLFDMDVTSHGICLDHEQGLLRQIEALKMKQNPRLRRQRHARIQTRTSGSPIVPNCTTPWRRRRRHRESTAQLSLPFSDGEFRPVLAESAVVAGCA
jgi:hypothetical protein